MATPDFRPGLHICRRCAAENSALRAPDWREMARQPEEPDHDANLKKLEELNQLSPETLAKVRAAIEDRKKELQEQEAQEATEV